MTTRLKKKLAKQRAYQGFIDADGNNGGDMLVIQDNMDGTIHLRVGSCCVMAIDQVVPVEFVTAIISDIMIAHGNVESVIDGFGWDVSFKEKLKGMCSA